MHPRHVFLAAALAAAVLATGSAAAGDLVADAGETRVGYAGDVPVDGRVHGAESLSKVQWSLQVDGDDAGSQRFADPGALETSLNVTGLSGDVTLLLEVEDGSGATANDTVVYHVGDQARVLAVEDETGAGVPDEIVGASGADQQTRRYTFDVAPGAARLEASLDWGEDPGLPLLGNDFDLYLEDPSGETATGHQGATLSKPERVSVGDPAAGTWTARVEGWLHGPDTIHLEARTKTAPPAPVPDPRVGGPYHFGSEDTQRLFSHRRSEANLSSLTWDLDADGHADSENATAVADRPQGTHEVILRAEESRGYEARATTTVAVDEAVDHAYDLNCGGSFWQQNWTMEWSATRGTCWWHGGHHTYFLDGTYTLAGGSGSIFSVEQQLSPPRSADASVDGRPGSAGVDVDVPVRLEVSLHGREWTPVGVASYDFAAAGTDGFSYFQGFRQRVSFDLEATDQPFRYFRIHQPRSTAEGLSGFIDASDLTLRLDDHPAATPGTAPDGPRNLSCQDRDILEDFFPAHPCTFGGVNRYDAASFLHTYPLGPATDVAEVSGEASVAPWRKDDYFIPIPGPPPLADADHRAEADADPSDGSVHAEAHAEVTAEPLRALDYPDALLNHRSQVTDTRLYVQTSSDGTNWTTHERIPVRFGEPANFTVDVGEEARWVRLQADYHPLYDERADAPSLHHPEGYMLDSSIRVVPAGSS